MKKKISLMTIGKKRLPIALFAMSSGLSLSVGSSVIPAWLTSLDFDLKTIGVASLLGMPYLCKFLWAPFFDQYRFLRLPQTEGWLCFMHLVLACFAVLLGYTPKLNSMILLPVLLVFGFFAASLDIVIDGHRTGVKEITAGEKNALYVFCYRVAMMLSGLCLICADYFGWRIAFLSIALYFLIGAWVSLRISPETKLTSQQKIDFKAGWTAFLKRKHSIIILLFILSYKMSIGFAVALNTPFLMKALHFTLTDIGVVLKGVGFASNMAGVFLGGYLLNRIALSRALFYFLVLETVAIFLFVIMSYVPPNYQLMVFSVGFEQFSSGLATIAMLTFIMKQTMDAYKNTQFALLSSMTAFGRVLVAPFSGWAVEAWGWGGFYLLAIALSIPALGLCLHAVIRKEPDYSASTQI